MNTLRPRVFQITLSFTVVLGLIGWVYNFLPTKQFLLLYSVAHDN